jgi:hypothetical protein
MASSASSQSSQQAHGVPIVFTCYFDEVLVFHVEFP